MRDAADMPDLDEDAPAALMHAVGDLAPARDLFFRVNTGRVLIALALLRYLACFGDQQTGRSALPVIIDRERARHHAGRHRAVARQRRHHKTVGQGDRAKLVGLEEFGLAHVGAFGKWKVRESWTSRPGSQCPSHSSLASY